MEISGKSFHLNLRLNTMQSQIWYKITGIGIRLFAYLRSIPVRTKRLLSHFWKGISFFRKYDNRSDTSKVENKAHHIMMWWLGLICYLADLLGLPEIYETIADFIKFNARPLTGWEIDLAKSIFGNTIDYRRIRIDELSISGPKQYKFCYVSFYIINSWGPMQNSTLIHEITHIWQFQKFGSIYILKALKAQRSLLGYDYGGVKALKDCQEKGKRFLSFNFEQQGDIVSDYYRIKNGYQPCWGNASLNDLPVYESFIKQLSE